VAKAAPIPETEDPPEESTEPETPKPAGGKRRLIIMAAPIQQFQIDWRVMFSPTIRCVLVGWGRDQLDGWVKVVVSRRL
jgi:hypothetical protein